MEVASATLRIRGPDSNTFLQGQFTQDLRKPVGAVSYGLWLNQKGKCIADSFVLRVAEEEFVVWAPRVENTTLRQRIDEYIIADDVELLGASAGVSGATVIWGDGAAAVVAQRFGTVPEPGRFAQGTDGLVFGGRFSRGENFVCLTADATVTVREFEQAGAMRGTRDSLEAERIVSALPAVPDDIGLNDLPNEGGLDIDAISYTKGCYLGQEVMSRLKNLGQVRRRLMVVAGSGARPAVLAQVQQDGKAVGQIRSSARVGDGFVAMAMISLVNFNRTAPLALEDGRPLEVRHG
ncbi:MAG: folate-binding protein YgfZ [Candidatus Didemnitutus sp.]|nr:folate-binding protein YgfZ [Candidatus Didemnitutus sp.]